MLQLSVAFFEIKNKVTLINNRTLKFSVVSDAALGKLLCPGIKANA